ncbi:hypothetical protein CYFUS_002121 [Cystobacter fuscus]|uniref:Glycosyltransferase RgtA/B/C/D-like domain-containing protein n=1 Tax=Cystobacter fuscus TaxID=43 RepID=A0A250J0K9_9BACT|nr:hypothetical protein [Cystobacter fuscus]ATB36706.1 hypothetical protein CYFUS_002121 [Cystobacter fuscus]
MSRSKSKRARSSATPPKGPSRAPAPPAPPPAEPPARGASPSEAPTRGSSSPEPSLRSGSPPERPSRPVVPVSVGEQGSGVVGAAVRTWLAAYRVEVVLFLVSFAVLASFSSQRFLRQSEAPHFVYQAKAWLEGRLDLDPEVLPNLEDWACVREVAGAKVRCEGPPRPGDRWYVSFPSFPAVVMLPFVAINGYQFNDTSFGVFTGALAVALFYALLRFLTKEGETPRTWAPNAALALTLGFGTLFFYAAIRGEVWFSAEVMGVAFTCLYARNAVRAHRPVLAGLFFSMATLTRTPLLFTGLFFVLEAVCPGPDRLSQLKDLGTRWKPVADKLGRFVLGAAPLGLLAAAYNFYRFGSLTEFGHRFLYNNRVNVDIDRLGLFNPAYLPRNLEAAFLKLPGFSGSPPRLTYDPHGLTLLLTLPLLVFLLIPKKKPRLHWPVWLTVAVTALPGLFYQNTGYMQFGFRFSIDYTPYLLLLFALGGWSLRHRAVVAALVLGGLVNFWGAVAFRGYTELVRNW